MISLKSSYQFDDLGKTANVDYSRHINNLIEHLLFTTPGERVNRPDFGSGLLQKVFEPNGTEIAATLQFLVRGALNQWLGNLIEINNLEITNDDSTLEVSVLYTILKTSEQQTAVYRQSF